MIDVKRRHFLQAATSLLGGAYLSSATWNGTLWAADAPVFADKPAFDPEVVILTWQRDPTTTMTVQWVGTPEQAAERPIWYAKDGSMDWHQAPAETRPFPGTNFKIFRTELTGLEPGGEYRFRIGLDGSERRFRTMPAKANDTLQFISGGDAGVGKATAQTNALAAKQDPMFVFLGGDLAYENGMMGSVFMQFMKMYSQQMIDSQGRMIPLLACIGNHEVRGSYGQGRASAPFFYAFFDGIYPDTGFAALDFGDYMSMVMLDTNHTTPVAGEQTSWLEKTLKEREECPNLFVLYHVPSYPSFRPFDLDDNEKGTGADSRKLWCPLFERYNVDAVFEHHDHTYKRTHPLINGHVDANGVPYLGDGSWGKIRRPKTTQERPYLAVAHEAYHFSVHRIEGRQRFHVALSDSGKVVDVCTTRKRAAT